MYGLAACFVSECVGCVLASCCKFGGMYCMTLYRRAYNDVLEQYMPDLLLKLERQRKGAVGRGADGHSVQCIPCVPPWHALS